MDKIKLTLEIDPAMPLLDIADKLLRKLGYELVSGEQPLAGTTAMVSSVYRGADGKMVSVGICRRLPEGTPPY